MEGVCVLSGVASTLASSTPGALFEAMIAATTIASHHGFQHILFLTASRKVAQVFKKEKATDWLDIKSYGISTFPNFYAHFMLV